MTKNSGTSPTIYDVAELASVSIATVSRVLNSPKLVSEKTCVKVLEAIDTLSFVPKVAARERARKIIGNIGVITPFFTLPSFSQRLRGIAAGLVDSPYSLTIYPVDSKERLDNYFTVLPYYQQLDGLIVVALPVDAAVLQRMQQSEIPMLSVENHIPGCPSIEIDNWYGGKLVAEHFIQKKHTRCAYVGDVLMTEYTLRPEDARLEGYQQTLLQHNIALPKEHIKLPVFPSRDQDKQVHELLDLNRPPTAIFAATDDLALRVLKIARKRGFRIPEDLAIVGFDDLDIAAYLDLTTVSQSLFESGKLAAQHLIAQIAEPVRPIERTFVQLRLVERNTT